MLKTVVSVTYMHVRQTMNVVTEFAAMVNVPWLAETKMIAVMANIVWIIDAQLSAPVTANAVKDKHVNKVYALLVAVVIKTVAYIYRVTITFARIHAKKTFVDRTLCVNLKIMQQNVNARPVLKLIQHQNRDVFAFHPLVFQPAAVQMVTCALEIFVKCHVRIQFHVRLVNDVITMFALKFVIQIITVYRVKYVMNVEHAKRVV